MRYPGEKGARLDVPTNMDTGTAREAELHVASASIGIRNSYFLGCIDGELDGVDADEIMNKMLEIMQQVRPSCLVLDPTITTFQFAFSLLPYPVIVCPSENTRLS